MQTKQVKPYGISVRCLDSTQMKLSQFGNFSYLWQNWKLRIIAKKTLRDFWEIHPDSEQQLKSWYQETLKAAWKGPNQIKLEYPSASFLVDNRVVFNIKGNHFR